MSPSSPARSPAILPSHRPLVGYLHTSLLHSTDFNKTSPLQSQYTPLHQSRLRRLVSTGVTEPGATGLSVPDLLCHRSALTTQTLLSLRHLLPPHMFPDRATDRPARPARQRSPHLRPPPRPRHRPLLLLHLLPQRPRPLRPRPHLLLAPSVAKPPSTAATRPAENAPSIPATRSPRASSAPRSPTPTGPMPVTAAPAYPSPGPLATASRP